MGTDNCIRNTDGIPQKLSSAHEFPGRKKNGEHRCYEIK